MKIEQVKLTGFRKFSAASVSFAEKTLIIGANDVGKSNLLHALRMLLDRSVSETEIEPRESDFHVDLKGLQGAELRIEVKLTEITEDAVLSRMSYIKSLPKLIKLTMVRQPPVGGNLKIN